MSIFYLVYKKSGISGKNYVVLQEFGPGFLNYNIMLVHSAVEFVVASSRKKSTNRFVPRQEAKER